MLAIYGATVYTPNEQINEGVIVVSGEHIVSVGEIGEINIPDGAQVIDATGFILAPGFIDLQFNGGFGHYFTSDPDSIWIVAAELPRYGVTSFLPTVVTAPMKIFSQSQNALINGNLSGKNGATPLGLHFEGPFLNPIKKGAHNPEFLCPPMMESISSWMPEKGVRLVTLAPELPGALELVKELDARGITVSGGHTMASYDEPVIGFDAGIRYGTHLFNAMRPLGHRKPGVVGALLGDSRCVVGIIPDGIHLHPGIVELVWAMKGPEKMTLVTDAMAAFGMPPGHYQIDHRDVTVTDVDARLPDGTLAGSVISLDEGLRNFCAYTKSPISDALKTITSTPASVLGIDDQRGRIAPGCIADLVLLDTDLKVMKTIVKGQVMYTKETESLEETML